MNTPIKLSIIIVSWNCQELLKKCLDSITATKNNLEPEVIVVDNASSDGTSKFLNEMIRHDLHGREKNNEDLKTTLNRKNLGFAQGNNIGLKQATGEYILLLNPDTELRPNALEFMLEFMEERDKCGVLGPKLLNSDGSIQLSIRKFPTLISQILVLLKLHNFMPKMKLLADYFQLNLDYTQEQQVDQVMGAALMIRKEVLTQLAILDGRTKMQVEGSPNLQLFDPKFKRIFEEVDFCKRVNDKGWQIWYAPDAEVVHHKGSSFAKTGIIKKQLGFNQGMRCYFWKHKPRWQHLVILMLQPVSWLLTLLQAVLARLGDPLRKKYKKAEL